MVISADNMGGIQNVRISDIHLNGACNSLAARYPSTLRGGFEAFVCRSRRMTHCVCARAFFQGP